MTGNAQHRHIVKRIEIVFGDAAFTLWLYVSYFSMGKTQFGDQPAKIGVGVINAANSFDNLTAVKAKAGEVLNLPHIRNAADGAVVESAYQKHQWCFAALGFDTGHYREAQLPLPDKSRNQFGWILQIRSQ